MLSGNTGGLAVTAELSRAWVPDHRHRWVRGSGRNSCFPYLEIARLHFTRYIYWMKYLSAFFLVLATAASHAQTDSVRVKVYDSLSTNTSIKQLDSLQQRFATASDSLKMDYARRTQRVVALKQRYKTKLDSLKGLPSRTPDSPLDTIAMPLDAQAYSKKMDSLDRQLEHLRSQATSRMDSLKQSMTSRMHALNLPKGSEDKVAAVTFWMDKVDLPAVDTDILSKTGLNLPTTLPEFPGGNLPDVNLPDIQTGIPDLGVNTPDLKNNLPGTTLNTGDVGKIAGQAGDIAGQVKEATGSVDGLGQTLEQQAAQQVKGLPEQKLPDDMGIPGGVPQTEEAAKQQLVDMAKKEAVNHFAGKEAALTGAMEKLSKYKQKYSSVNSIKDLPKQSKNSLKGKPLRERLVPALTLQVQSWEHVMLDVNPSVGYKLTSRITAGLGWNQRWAYNIPDRGFRPGARVFGIRSYGEYSFKKGFGFRLDIESMNGPLKSINPQVEQPYNREWVWSAMAGVKQRYPIYKKLKGNAQVMYNLVDPNHRSPYVDRVNFRLGLEFTLKRKKKTSGSDKAETGTK